jgi:hypothetical protein
MTSQVGIGSHPGPSVGQFESGSVTSMRGRVPAMPPEAPGQPPIETRRAPRRRALGRADPLCFPATGFSSWISQRGPRLVIMSRRRHRVGNDSERSLQIVHNALRLRRNPPPSLLFPGMPFAPRIRERATCAARRRECRAERLQHAPSAGVQCSTWPRAPVWRALARLTDVAPIPGDEVPQASALGFASWDPPRAVDEGRP